MSDTGFRSDNSSQKQRARLRAAALRAQQGVKRSAQDGQQSDAWRAAQRAQQANQQGGHQAGQHGVRSAGQPSVGTVNQHGSSQAGQHGGCQVGHRASRPANQRASRPANQRAARQTSQQPHLSAVQEAYLPRSLQSSSKSFPVVPFVAAAAVLLLLAVLLFNVVSCAVAGGQGASSAQSGSSSEAAEEPIEPPSWDALPTSFSALSNSKSGIFGFSLADASIAPSLSSEHQQAIEEAIKVFEDANRSVGFVLIDMDTGVGFASNVDAEVYGASSFKAPFVAYVCSDFVDAGTVSLSSQIPSIVSSGDVYYASGQETIQQLIEWSVVDSDNASFGALREYFGGGPASTVVGSSPLGTNSGLQELMRTWLAGTGADASIADDEEWFPFLSARDMACLWTYLGNYLATGTDAANFLKQQLADTDTSFIRDALEGSGATVLSKAGWCNSSEEEYNSVCDSGIVELDGHAYLLTVMTGATYYDSSVQHVEDLIAAIFDARGDLEQLQQVG